MQVLLHFVDEIGPTVIPRVRNSLALHLRSHVIYDELFIVVGVQVGDFSRGEQIIDVNQEILLRDLALSEQEQVLFVLNSAFIVEHLQIFLQVVNSIARTDGDAVADHSHDEGREFCQTLFSGSSHSHKQGVP